MTVTVRIVPHWFTGWFLRLFSRPYLVVDGHERRVGWGRAVAVISDGASLQLGAGIRYFGRGALLGCEPETVDVPAPPPGAESTLGKPSALVLHNGFWNHEPFRISRR